MVIGQTFNNKVSKDWLPVSLSILCGFAEQHGDLIKFAAVAQRCYATFRAYRQLKHFNSCYASLHNGQKALISVGSTLR